MPHSGANSLRRTGSPRSNFCDVRSMEPPRDFCELLECFNANRVSALIVGAYAHGFYGAPRMSATTRATA